MQLKKLKDIIKSIGTPNKDDTLLGVFGGKTAQKSIEDILSVADYTALQNLPRTLCSGTLELTAIADGGYEAIAETSITYNGVEKFTLDKGNLLFLKDGTVNIQNGYGCFCIDSISEQADDDWTNYFGATKVDIENLEKNINERYQTKIKCGNGIDIVGRQHTLSLQNGSTVLEKANMTTAITASGRYDIAESGDMLIGFPGVTDFTPFTLKVNKGDIIKLLFDTEKNVTDVLYIGDISQNYAETTINNVAKQGYYKNPFFDITAFELSVNTDKKAYTELTVEDCINYTNFNYDLTDVSYKLDNIPHRHHALIASTTKKDAWKNPVYEEVKMGSGLGLVQETSSQGTVSSRLNIFPAQLNLSEAQVTFTDPSDNTDITLSFRELLNDSVIPLANKMDLLTGCYQKIINTGIEEDCNIMSAKGWYISFDGSYSDKIIEPVTKQEVPIDYYVAMGDQFFVAPYTANELHHIDYINIRTGDTSGNFAILYREIAFNDNNEKVIDETIDLLSSAEKSEKLIASINNIESNKLFYSQGIDEVTGLPKLQAVTIGNGLKFENGVLSIE